MTGKSACIADKLVAAVTKIYLVVGAGPNGLNLTERLLKQDQNAVVIITEKRVFDRPQVVQMPFLAATLLPEDVRRLMYDDTTRARIFGVRSEDDRSAFPAMDHIRDMTPIAVSSFQVWMAEYLQKTYAGRFYCICDEFDFSSNQANDDPLGKVFDNVFENYKRRITHVDGIFLTCGASEVARSCVEGECGKDASISGKPYENLGDGVYLTFNTNKHESYERNGEVTPMSQFCEYFMPVYSNNANGDVQVYTMHTAISKRLPELKDIPESFKERCSYGRNKQPIAFDGNGLDEEAMLWWESYRKVLIEGQHALGYHFPEDTKVWYAGRGEYYYDHVAFEWTGSGRAIPVFYIGDAAGGTDWVRFGASLMRGMRAGLHLADLVASEGVHGAINPFQSYWEEIIRFEFNKKDPPTDTPELTFKYSMEGRKFQKGNEVYTLSPGMYDGYAKLHRAIVAAETSETSSC